MQDLQEEMSLSTYVIATIPELAVSAMEKGINILMNFPTDGSNNNIDLTKSKPIDIMSLLIMEKKL